MQNIGCIRYISISILFQFSCVTELNSHLVVLLAHVLVNANNSGAHTYAVLTMVLTHLQLWLSHTPGWTIYIALCVAVQFQIPRPRGSWEHDWRMSAALRI